MILMNFEEKWKQSRDPSWLLETIMQPRFEINFFDMKQQGSKEPVTQTVSFSGGPTSSIATNALKQGRGLTKKRVAGGQLRSGAEEENHAQGSVEERDRI